jgi:hypothetical protein
MIFCSTAERSQDLVSADADQELLGRRARITTAAVRAAYAWSVRERDRRAFKEVARMTGVIMVELGPDRGPVTPMDLIRCLRRPLGPLLPPLTTVAESGDSRIEGISLLTADDVLSPEAYEIGSDYVREVIGGLDPGHDWLPKWSWMRAEDLEHQLFGALIGPGKQSTYTASRRFLIEHPAGPLQTLAEKCTSAGAERLPGAYIPIPHEQTWVTSAGRVWWPCPVCRWPMDVKERLVRCRYSQHKATFQVVERAKSGVTLSVINASPSSSARPKLPQPRPADDAVQIIEAGWRFIVVPGASELRIYEQLNKPGVSIDLYPGFDAYDMDIRVGDRRWDVDVKEHSTVEGLVRHVREKPPVGRYLVLPHSHAHQVHGARAALDDYTVWTEAELITDVKSALRRWKRVSS